MSAWHGQAGRRQHLLRGPWAGPQPRRQARYQARSECAAVGGLGEGAGPAAQRRTAVQQPLRGGQRRPGPQRPDLVPHLVEEALAGIGVGRAERAGLVHHDAGRAEQAGLAPEQPGGELEIVVPQEVVSLGQAPGAADAGVHQDRHERRRPDRQAPGRGRGEALRLAGERLGPGGVHRVRAAIGPHHPAGDQRRRPARAQRTGVEHGLERARFRHRVVVHQPDQVGRVGQGQRQAVGEPAGAAGVALHRGQPHGGEAGADHLRRVVGRGVVDHDDRVRGPGLSQHRGQRLDQQVPPVVGDHDRDHPGRPAPVRRVTVRHVVARHVRWGRHVRSASGPGCAPWPAR